MKEPGRRQPKQDWAGRLAKFERKLGCRFRDKSLLFEALTHPSYANEHSEEDVRDYERLEFLGDAVLELATSHHLYELKTEESEGFLTRARADLVNKKRLARLAEELGIGEVIRLGTGEIKAGGARKASILAASFEAVLGAAYLDRGWSRVFRIIERLVGPAAAVQPEELRDPRSIMQEWAQAQNGTTPEYRYLPSQGPPHKKIFRVKLVINERVVAIGEGRSKKEACRHAAAEALKEIMP